MNIIKADGFLGARGVGRLEIISGGYAEVEENWSGKVISPPLFPSVFYTLRGVLYHISARRKNGFVSGQSIPYPLGIFL